MRVSRHYLPAATTGVAVLGSMISAGRRERGWTSAAFAERLGVSVQTLRRLESGSPSVAVGLAFEAALLCGVELFSTAPDQLDGLARQTAARAALLPTRVRTAPVQLDDDF